MIFGNLLEHSPSRTVFCMNRGNVQIFALTCKFTSIGTKKNTCKNRSLLLDNGQYAHAEQLEDWSLERGVRSG